MQIDCNQVYFGKLPESSESSQLVSVKGVARFASTTVLALLSPRPAKSKKSFLSAQPETETYSQAAIICHGRVGNLDIVRAGPGNANIDGLTPLTFTSTIYTYHFSKDKGAGGDEVLRIQQ